MKLNAQILAGSVLVLAALGLKIYGQPKVADQWTHVAPKFEPLLENREVQIDPGELHDLMFDTSIKLLMLDVRDESCYNIFHLQDAILVTLEELPQLQWHTFPANTVVVTMSNDERDATEAWKRLKLLQVPNAYILEGGINRWLDIFGHDEHHEFCAPDPTQLGNEVLRHKFLAALGHRQLAAHPEMHHKQERTYTKKVKLANQGRKGGGCG